MAAEELDGAGEGTGEEVLRRRKLSGKKLVLFIILPLLLLLGAGTGLYFSGILGPEAEEAAPAGAEAVPAGPPVYYDLPDLLVNLNTSERRPTFLKISVSLLLARPEDRAQLDTVMPQIIDNFQIYLRELRLDDLRGSAGMYRLREELLLRVNAAAAPVGVQVSDVLFREMLVQ